MSATVEVSAHRVERRDSSLIHSPRTTPAKVGCTCAAAGGVAACEVVGGSAVRVLIGSRPSRSWKWWWCGRGTRPRPVSGYVRLLEAGAARGQFVQQQPVSEGDLADVRRGGPADLEHPGL